MYIYRTLRMIFEKYSIFGDKLDNGSFTLLDLFLLPFDILLSFYYTIVILFFSFFTYLNKIKIIKKSPINKE